MAVTQLILGFRHSEDNFKSSIRIWTKVDLSNFKNDIIVGAENAGLTISECSSAGIFMHSYILGLKKLVQKKRKYLLNGSCVE